MDAFVGWLVAGFVPGFVTSVALGVLRFLRSRTVNRRRWGLSSPDRVRICVSASPDVETGQYRRPSTGIGQAKALALIAPSLTRGWRNIDIQSVYFPQDLSGQELEADLILLGGPKTNQLTRWALDLLGDSLGVTQDGSVIEAGDTLYEGHTDADTVTVDYRACRADEKSLLTRALDGHPLGFAYLRHGCSGPLPRRVSPCPSER